MNMRKWILLICMASVLLAITLPTLAEGDEDAPADIVPAVVVEEAAPAEPVPDWTYRYLVPTCLALALVFCVITVVLYFTRVVKSRYKSVS
jgi:hypothetical protein